ncbi:hypothetical protein Leryth_024524 [Lithospermum erythrorhizon]|nr:hypothetical protein Leryth_024524 [Lithospermum erythrorhizon]
MKIHDPFEAGPSNWNDEEDDAYWSSSDSMEENLNEPGEETDIMDIELAPSGGGTRKSQKLNYLSHSIGLRRLSLKNLRLKTIELSLLVLIYETNVIDQKIEQG